MKLLREYIRELLTEAPVTKPEIEDAIQNASFNSSNSSSHRWSTGQPYIDYYFDDAAGDWKFQAAFPDTYQTIQAQKRQELLASGGRR